LAPPEPPLVPVRNAIERPRILVVSPFYLYPSRHGAAIRLTELLRRIRRSCDVHLLVAIGGSDDPEQERFLAPLCRSVHFHQVRHENADERTDGLPPRAAAYATWSLVQRISALAFAHEIDAIQFENSELAPLVGLATASNQILVELDLTFRSVARLRRGPRGQTATGALRWESLAWLQLERQALAGADQVHCMSRVDRDVLARLSPADAERLRVIPNGTAVSPETTCSVEGRDVLFVGSFPHLPNQQALQFMIEEVWPRIRAALPDRRLVVVGAGPPEWVLRLDGRDGIEVAGEVESLASFYARAAVSVVPVLSGSGTRLKILEALAAGVPVVSTTIGAEGLDCLRPGIDFLIADGARDLAVAVVDLMSDPQRARRLARDGHERVAGHYSWDRIAEDLERAYRELEPVSSPREREVPERLAAEMVRETLPPEGAESPAITVVVDALHPGSRVGDLLEALTGQVEQRFEVVVLMAPSDVPHERIPDLLAGRVRHFECPEPGYGAGRLARAALRHGRGRILVFLDARVQLHDPAWLGHLTWPLLQPAPPSAVEGSTLGSGGMEVAGPRLTLHAAATNLEVCHLSFRHSAVSRRLLETLPPSGDDGFPALGWSLQLAAHGGWVLAERKAQVRLIDDRVMDEESSVAPRAEPGAIQATVVVCDLSREADLEIVLEGLFAQVVDLDWEILVVEGRENGRPAGWLRRLADRAPVPLRSVHAPTASLSEGRNLGLRLARGGWVAFLEVNARPQPGWLAALAQAMKPEQVVAAGGPVDLWCSGTLPYWFRMEFLQHLPVWDRGPIQQPLTSADLPRGAAFVVRADPARRAGGFRLELGRSASAVHPGAEVALLTRLLDAGGAIRYAPEARVWLRVEARQISRSWMRRRLEQSAFSEAILDWIHGGVDRLRKGREVRRRSQLPERGHLGAIAEGFRAAARAAYRRGAAYALIAVPRA